MISLLLLAALQNGAPARPDAYAEKVPAEAKDKTVDLELVGIPGAGDLKPFWIGKFEITHEQYGAFLNAEELTVKEEPPREWLASPWIKYKSDGEARWKKEEIDAVSTPSQSHEPVDQGWGFRGRPAIKMTHRFAREYCKWLTKMTGKTYRLPTEAEWVHACRAGSKTAWPCGDDAASLGEYAWFEANAEKKTHPVGQKKPNAWGLHDMMGNAMEYVSDTVPAKPDHKWAVIGRAHGVVKGGGWADGPDALKPEARRLEEAEWNARDPNKPPSICWHYDGPFIGFRVARSAE